MNNSLKEWKKVKLEEVTCFSKGKVPFEAPKTWQRIKLRQIGEIVGGGTPKTDVIENWNNGSIPWLTPADMRNFNGKYISRGTRNITEFGLKSSSAKMLPTGSIVYSSRAPIGYIAIISNPLCTNQGFRSIVPSNYGVAEYLYYCLIQKTPDIQAKANGTTFKEISGSEFGETVILLPPLPEQRAIAEVLGALDDKIEANNRQNKTLEAIAQALFKSWFVDFEPVKAKASGKQPEGLSSELADLFPSSFVDSPLGKIPEGWEVKKLADSAFIINGGTPSKNAAYWNGKIPWISIVDFNQSPRYLLETQKYITKEGIDNSSANILETNDIVISARGTVGAITQLAIPMAFNQSCYGLSAKEGLKNNYLYYFLVCNIKSIKNDTHGSVFDTITRDDLNKIAICLPSLSIQTAFDDILFDIHNKLISNAKQSRVLAAVRDAALPQLISGRVRIPPFGDSDD
jgi:type I restriction enzyme S subunit